MIDCVSVGAGSNPVGHPNIMSDSISQEELRQLRDLVERGLWAMDPNGNPEDTQFSYCTYCYVVEYRDHHKDCRSHEVMALFDKVEKAISNGKL